MSELSVLGPALISCKEYYTEAIYFFSEFHAIFDQVAQFFETFLIFDKDEYHQAIENKKKL